MARTPSPEKIVAEMLKNDHFSKWLDVDLIEISKSSCSLGCKITKSMLNGFGIAHGGICFSLADSCLAFAANARGHKCVSTKTSIELKKKVFEGDYLIAKSNEIKRGSKNAQFEINITNQDDELVAYFKGDVYISSKKWDLEQMN